MIVEQIWTGNAYRNYNYLIACPHSGEAIAIDPLESQMCFDKAKEKGWHITKILNTHEHGDHTGGNINLINLTGAEVMAPEGASKNIPGMTIGLIEGDIVKIGKELELDALIVTVKEIGDLFSIKTPTIDNILNKVSERISKTN